MTRGCRAVPFSAKGMSGRWEDEGLPCLLRAVGGCLIWEMGSPLLGLCLVKVFSKGLPGSGGPLSGPRLPVLIYFDSSEH